ncbi:delta(3,5)-Delta(2,4)-dienoyl-CoA isomerase, mitochondrial isoform X3 [Phycodurus eques]|nr:delta(3,5)-Delta(2,4)-dienoyl-CoA isomerase, mitochondrial isoform X3 [Phycodurus eques]
MSSSGGTTAPYTTLAISRPAQAVTHVELHRPNKRNAMNKAFWSEMVDCFNEISGDPDCRVVVVSAAGKVFTAGIDLVDMAADVLQPDGDDTARISWNLRKTISKYQDTFSVIETCPKPVVVAVHGACVGGGVDLITACDIRLCTQDAWFQVKPGERAGSDGAEDVRRRGPEQRTCQPSVCRQGGHDGRRAGDGRGGGRPQPCGRAGHQSQLDLLPRPQCSGGTQLHGYVEHEHASDSRCDEIRSGLHGKEEYQKCNVLQTLNRAQYIHRTSSSFRNSISQTRVSGLALKGCPKSQHHY